MKARKILQRLNIDLLFRLWRLNLMAPNMYARNLNNMSGTSTVENVKIMAFKTISRVKNITNYNLFKVFRENSTWNGITCLEYLF